MKLRAPFDSQTAAWSIVQRFQSKVSQTPNCWEWTGCKNSNGYGCFGWPRGKGFVTRSAHRVAWIFAYGEIPNGSHVLHHCDNPGCVRPDHLFLGNPALNAGDKISKGRQWRPIGERHHLAKLSEQDVRDIRRRISGGETCISLAREYGVAGPLISYIRHRKIWSHVE